MTSKWTLKQVLQLWPQYRVVGGWGSEVEGVHSFVETQLNRIELLINERDDYKVRALRAETRLEQITDAIKGHIDDKK